MGGRHGWSAWLRTEDHSGISPTAQHQIFFPNESVLGIRWAKYWSLGIVAMHNYHSKIIVVQGCILSPLFNLYAAYIMQNGRITSWNQHCLEKYQ